MKKKTFPQKMHFILLVIAIFISFTSIAQPTNWTPTNTGNNHTILIQTTAVITINGSSLDIGDYIGVFWEDNGSLYCGGYTIWDGLINVITAWGDETNAPGKNGFDPGETFQWIIWDSSANLYFNAVVTYMTTLPNQGTYFPNGMSGVATAISSSNIIPTITSPTCFGFSDGSINLNITNGTGPYSFSWSNGATSQNLVNLAAGIYTVTVTDISTFSDSLTMEVTQPEDIAANILVNEDSAFMCMSHAQVFPTGGTAPYSYLWNTVPPQTSQLAELCPGLFNVTITDSNNCQTNVDVVVDVNSQNVIDTAFTLIDTCLITTLPDTAYISNLLYSSGTMIIEWTFEFGSNSIVLNTYYPGITTPGLYYIGLVINCPTKTFPTITFISVYNIPPMLELSGITSDVSCNGLSDGSINLFPIGGTLPYSYIWSTGDTIEDINSLGAGNYSVTISDSNGSNSVAGFIISEPTSIEIINNISNLICNSACNGSIDLAVTGGNSPYTFLWSNGQSNMNLNDLCASDYSLTITDSNGCLITNTYEITEPDLIEVIGTTADVSCSCCYDGNINLITSGGIGTYTYLWSNGEITEDINSLYPGVYVVTVTDSNGCSITSTFEITGSMQLQLNGITTNVSCNGLSDGSINITVNGGLLPYSYTWSNGESSENIFALNSGIYEVTITDSLGCNTISSFEITQPELLEVTGITNDASSYGICDGSINITVQGGTPVYIYVWSNGEFYEDIENLCAGNYIVTVTDNNNCTDTISFVITEPSSLLNPVNETFVCTINPNPIKDNLYLYIENTKSKYMNVEIYNAIGSMIYDIKIELNNINTSEINIPNLVPGIYIAKVYNQYNQSAILKFIK